MQFLKIKVFVCLKILPQVCIHFKMFSVLGILVFYLNKVRGGEKSDPRTSKKVGGSPGRAHMLSTETLV